jgi:hypothetical protein
MDTATTKTRCDVADQIPAWTTPDGTLQVEKGDLILDDGGFQLLAAVTLVEDGRADFVAFTVEGRTETQYAGKAELVAVRRYVETTGE